MNIRIPTSYHDAVRDQLVDVAIDCYVDWRGQSRTAVEAYETWTLAPPAQLPLAFAAYQQALEQEECAATVYARAIQGLDALLAHERQRG